MAGIRIKSHTGAVRAIRILFLTVTIPFYGILCNFVVMSELSGALKPLGLLEVIAGKERPATLAELALDVKVPRPTLHRWLMTLTNAGLLQRTPNGRRYELAKRASQLAFSILSNELNATTRHAILQRTVEKVGEACNLTIMEGTQVCYLDRVESTWPLRITFQQGSRVPAYCSASGKLFLAFMPPAKRERLLRALSFERFTDNTVTEKRALLKELAEIRREEYALDREEYLSGLVCLAVPIYQHKKRGRICAAALALQAPVARLSSENMLNKLPILREEAEALAATLA